MAGKRLLDAALLFNATRSIASQHVKIRSQQLDAWSKTSSLAKAVKSQTERVTLRAQAANALAKRFNEPSPATQYTTPTQRTQDDQAVPRQENVEGSGQAANVPEGINQDHHYTRSEENATEEPTRDGDLEMVQKRPQRLPTAEGSTPPTGAPVEPPDTDKRVLDADVDSGRHAEAAPAIAPLKEELVKADDLNPRASGKSTIISPEAQTTARIPEHELVPEQEEIPEGINTDVFRTRRVKEILGVGANSRKSKGELGVHGSTGQKSSLGGGIDQEIFSIRQSERTRYSFLAESDTAQNQAKFASQLSPVKTQSTQEFEGLAAEITSEIAASQQPNIELVAEKHYEMRESRVPSSRFARLWQYGGLATSMAFGAVGESFRRAAGGGSSGPLMLSGQNMERLVAKLSRMRGAALKLGQMMSFQDSKMLPAPIAEVLQRVQDNADYMPASQRNAVLADNLGSSWRDLFSSFDETPLAAASIGQVHRAVIKSTGKQVAVKIQYPGVAKSISSDLNNLSVLLTATRLLPKGLYLDKTIANARTELAWECDYVREAAYQERFRTLLADERDIFTVPATVPEACGKHVLTAEFMQGKGVTKAAKTLSQEQKDWIGTHILRLCLRELTEFKLMQTDPNWTNFLFNAQTYKLELLDFGAAREYPEKFVNPYIRILIAAVRNDRDTIRENSIELGYLTGHESKAMLDAHVTSVLTLAEPFRETEVQDQNLDEVYDFRDQTITDRVRALIPVMVKERLAPPPEETYSLHRKLSGAFLMLARLGSRVRCRRMFRDAVGEWKGRVEGRVAGRS